MNAEDVRFYRERWKEVEAIEREQRRAMPIEEHWRRLNAIARFARETGMSDAGHGEGEVWERWARLKVRYESELPRKP